MPTASHVSLATLRIFNEVFCFDTQQARENNKRTKRRSFLILHFFTKQMTSSFWRACNRPTRCGENFTDVPYKRERGIALFPNGMSYPNKRVFELIDECSMDQATLKGEEHALVASTITFNVRHSQRWHPIE
jgi:hypothetical protein